MLHSDEKCLIKSSKNHPLLFMLSDKVPYSFFLLNLFIVKHITFIKKYTKHITKRTFI